MCIIDKFGHKSTAQCYSTVLAVARTRQRYHGFGYYSRSSIIFIWTRIVHFPPTMSLHTSSVSRILPKALRRRERGEARRCPASALGLASRLRPAGASYSRTQRLESQPRFPVSICTVNHRSYASAQPRPPGGTYRMNLGNDKGAEKLALEQYGVDLTSKARDGKLDPVIGRDSVCRFFHSKRWFCGQIAAFCS